MLVTMMHVLLLVLAPSLVYSFICGASVTKYQSSILGLRDTSLHAKITPNQGESMDMYRKVSGEEDVCPMCHSHDVFDQLLTLICYIYIVDC